MTKTSGVIKKKHNMLIVMSDQHAVRFMGHQGDSVVATPYMDKMAAQGISFNNFYCNSPLCVPARMSFMTGKTPWDNRVLTNHDSLSSDIPTFAHALTKEGYDCRLVGRMHFVGPDQLHGFSKRDMGDIGTIWPGGTPPDMGKVADARGNRVSELPNSGVGSSSYLTYDEHVIEKSLETLAELTKTYEETGTPFCLVVGLFLPHPPYLAPKELYDKYFDKVQPPVLAKQTPTDKDSFNAAWYEACEFSTVSDEVQKSCAAAYYASVEKIDSQVGQLMNALDQTGLGEETLFAYTSDHGEQLGERGMWWKSTFYEQSTKIPLILRLPTIITGNQTSDAVSSLVDLTATLVDFGQAELPNITGDSLLDIATQKEEGWKNQVVSEFYGGLMNVKTPGFRNRMVRQDQWKYNYFDGFPAQLFDLGSDPTESKNLLEDMDDNLAIVSQWEDTIALDWDVNEIKKWQARRKVETELISGWTKQTKPEEYFRWFGSSDLNFHE